MTCRSVPVTEDARSHGVLNLLMPRVTDLLIHKSSDTSSIHGGSLDTLDTLD